MTMKPIKVGLLGLGTVGRGTYNVLKRNQEEITRRLYALSGQLVTISEEQGVYVGRLSQLFLEPGDDPNPICTECQGDKHNLPILGLVFIEGMKQSGLDYEDGTILDPETGKIYHANMHLSPDGSKLTVRGYIGLSIFGRSQTWNRVE